MIENYPPTVQFKTLDDFIADLAAGYPAAVYHELVDLPGFSKRMASTIRAIVRENGITHIASVTFRHRPLMTETGPANDSRQATYYLETHAELMLHVSEQLAEIGITSSSIRPGSVEISLTAGLIYAQLISPIR